MFSPGPVQTKGLVNLMISYPIPASKVGSDDYSKTSAPGDCDLNIKALLEINE